MSERPAARIYTGHVMHMRLQPKRHQFRYRVFSVLLDLDRMEEALRPLRLLKLDRPGLMSVRSADHGPRDGTPLRPWVDAQLRLAELPRPARVEMLAFPRMLGYAFNPLTVYYCYDGEDRLSALVYEVKNTFGDQIAYALPAGPEAGGSYRQMQGKEMYVSPFIDMDQTYRFTLGIPAERLALRIRQAGPEGEVLIAAHTARGEPMGDLALARAFVTHPLMTFTVIAAIHWHALRLFLKGVGFRRYSQRETARGRAA